MTEKYSNVLQEIMNRKPYWFIKWGNPFILVIIIIFLGFTRFWHHYETTEATIDFISLEEYLELNSKSAHANQNIDRKSVVATVYLSKQFEEYFSSEKSIKVLYDDKEIDAKIINTYQDSLNLNIVMLLDESSDKYYKKRMLPLNNKKAKLVLNESSIFEKIYDLMIQPSNRIPVN